MAARHRTPHAVVAAQSSQLMLPILDEPDSSGSSGRIVRSGSSCGPGRVTELLAIASREARVIREITACLEELTETQAAKRELCALTAAEVREAVESRHTLGVGLAADRPAGFAVVLGVST